MQRNMKHKTKGEALRVTVSDVGARGDGIADTPHGPVYVPFTMAGDEVDIWVEPGARGTLRATLEALVTPSEQRIEPVCCHFGRCGGCALQHMGLDSYQDWIMTRVRTALGHHGLADTLVTTPSISAPESRRRVALKALRTSKGVLLGFHERLSHHLVDVKMCPVARPVLVNLFKPIRELLFDLLPMRAAADVTLTETATGVDMLVSGIIEPGLEQREKLAAFADRYDVAALHVAQDGFNDPLAIRRTPMMDFAGVEVPLPPGAFVQATKDGEDALRKAVTDWTIDASRCVDLFAGIGTFSLPLAKTMIVDAVEGARPLVDAMIKGANYATGLKEFNAIHRDLFRRPLTHAELAVYDVVVIDPPRAGATAQSEALASSNVSTVVSISCNPNTFARDARTLVDGGYRLIEVRPIDQFLWSPHVELAALFQR